MTGNGAGMVLLPEGRVDEEFTYCSRSFHMHKGSVVLTWLRVEDKVFGCITKSSFRKLRELTNKQPASDALLRAQASLEHGPVESWAGPWPAPDPRVCKFIGGCGV